MSCFYGYGTPAPTQPVLQLQAQGAPTTQATVSDGQPWLVLVALGFGIWWLVRKHYVRL